jgi:hypothetical protein
VGDPLVATQPGTDVAVTFYIVEGNTTVFKIGLCNGQLRIANALLDSREQSVFYLVVQARSNALVTSATNATITVNVLRVPKPPVFNNTDCQLLIDEGRPVGTLLSPPVSAYDVDYGMVSYAVDPTSAGATLAAINTTSGPCVLSRLVSFIALQHSQCLLCGCRGLSSGQLRTLVLYDYEAPLRQFYITVVARNELLSSSLTCLVTIADVNEPPIILPNTFTIDEDAAFPMTSMGVLNAVDDDAGTCHSPASPSRLCASTFLMIASLSL